MPIEQEFQALLAKAAGDIGDDSCTGSETDPRIKQALEIMENSASTITAWEESTIRQLVDWVKILSAEEILVCLHGGIEIRQ